MNSVHSVTYMLPQSSRYEQLPKLLFSRPFVLKASQVYISSHRNETNHIIKYRNQNSIAYTQKWPWTSIGLILCEFQEDNKIFHVYGTGILIHKRIIFTSAMNAYNRRLKKQYTNIKFIPNVHFDRYNDICDVKKVYYPFEYSQAGLDFQKYNFAIMQLYDDDLNSKYGFIGYNTEFLPNSQVVYGYGYIRDDSINRFVNYNFIKSQDKSSIDNNRFWDSILMIKDQKGRYFVVGLEQLQQQLYLNEETRKIINQWTKCMELNFDSEFLGVQIYENICIQCLSNLTILNLRHNDINEKGMSYLQNLDIPNLKILNLDNNLIGSGGCQYLKKIKCNNLEEIFLFENNIGTQGCRYLQEANWKRLRKIYLINNNIDSEGCRYLKNANWMNLREINLCKQYQYEGANKIGPEGCCHLKDAKWSHLRSINLVQNNIKDEGCNYLKQADWSRIIFIGLAKNNISFKGCSLLKEAKWQQLENISLYDNNIDDEACKYLKDANWPNLSRIDLSYNYITSEGTKFLRDTTWPNLLSIQVYNNKIDFKGINYLKDTNWPAMKSINLRQNNIYGQNFKLKWCWELIKYRI